MNATLRVERPEDRTPYHFTVDEAAAFLAGWCRVVEADGSTVAYAPDETTARQIVEALAGGCVDTRAKEDEGFFDDMDGDHETALESVYGPND